MASHCHSDKSPSPLSSKHANPNTRTSLETNSAVRKSFTGNKSSVLTNPRRFDPNTPANSPLDLTRRCLADCDGKENEKDLNSKPSKNRPSGKGTKNFMSPTISAASKVTPSPKKKILAERNDPLRSSAIWCDGKAMFFSASNSSQEFDPNSVELPPDQSQVLENLSNLNNVVLEAPPPVSKPPKRVSFVELPSDSQPASESQSDSVITDSCDNLNSEPAFSYIAPLDADPSLPPYDPTTMNYLSPRPQFLYYKPNPRIQALMNKEKGMDPDGLEGLEDRYLAEIMSETFSDSEESQSEAGSEKEEPEVAADMVLGLEEDPSDIVTTENLVQEREMKPEVAGCAEKVLGLAETENDHVPEPLEVLSATATVTNTVITEKLAQEKERRPRGFSKLIRFSMLLMLFLGCASVCFTRPGSLDQLVHSGVMSFTDVHSSYYHESNIPDIAKESLETLARHVNELSANSINLMSKLIKPSERKLQVPLKFMNVTDLLQSNIWDEGNFLNSHDATAIVEEELTYVGYDVVGEGLVDSEEIVDSDEISSEDMVEDLEEDEFENDGDTDYEVESHIEVYPDENEIDMQTDVLGNEAVSTDSVKDPESSLPDVLSETEPVSTDSVMDDELESESLQTDMLENVAVSADSVMYAELESEILQYLQPDVFQNLEVFADSVMDAELSDRVQPDVLETSVSRNSGLDAALEFKSLLLAESETGAVSDVRAAVATKVESEMVEATSDTTTEVSESLLTSSGPYVIAASAFFTGLLPVVFLYLQKKKSPSSAVRMEKQAGSVHTQQHIHQEKQQLISQQTEVEDPLPSQISSSFRSLFYSKKEELRGETEAQSFTGSKARRFSKRESLASSVEYSTGSPSYGSFTTLERIPIKHGEDEIVTPVRRSSRIRKQITSP